MYDSVHNRRVMYGQSVAGLALRISRLICFAEVFDSDSKTGAQAGASGCNALKKSCIVLQSIIKPVFLGSETDQDSCRLPMSRYYNLFFLSYPEKPRKIIFYFGQWCFFHDLIPVLSSHSVASDLEMIVRISTTSSVTS